MSTLADQFHDSFEPYYAEKKTGWKKSAQERAAQKSSTPQQESGKEAPANPPVTESRH